MFIAMNRFRIAPGREAEFFDVWRQRDSHLAGVPGFRHFTLRRSSREPADCARERGVTSQPRTAFVFAGGGSLSALQVGMLAEILEAGERPDLIVGASAGAINGAFLAQSVSQEMIMLRERHLPRLAAGGDRHRMVPPSPLPRQMPNFPGHFPAINLSAKT
jgi:patatin-like phospholipase/antibiotic biosynthesis monooxygenase